MWDLKNLHPTNYDSIPICEASWSRVFQHIQSASSFAVISAFTLARHLDKKDAENYAAHEHLKNDLRQLGLGFVEQQGGYPYKVKTDAGAEIEGVSDELSLFIPNISFDQALMLGAKYDQESIIFKDDKRFILIFTKTFVDKDGNSHCCGDIDISFSKGEALTFNPEVLKYAFSRFRHGNKGQREQNFSYTGECVGLIEYRVPTHTESILAQKKKNGEMPQATGMRLF